MIRKTSQEKQFMQSGINDRKQGRRLTETCRKKGVFAAKGIIARNEAISGDCFAAGKYLFT
jgi:hypothetical protein